MKNIFQGWSDITQPVPIASNCLHKPDEHHSKGTNVPKPLIVT